MHEKKLKWKGSENILIVAGDFISKIMTKFEDQMQPS